MLFLSTTNIKKSVVCTLFPPKTEKKIHTSIILIVDFKLATSVSMFIGQVLSLEACRAAQAERRSANTATAAASAAATVAAASTAAAAET